MTIQALFIRANEELKKVIDQIKDDQWELQLPPGIAHRPATLHEAINYHTYDDAWVSDVLAGKTKDEVGDKYEAILTSSDPKVQYAKYNQLAIEAVKAFPDTDLGKVTHLSYGDFPAKEYLMHITSYRGFRVYDLAKIIGADTNMTDDLVQGLWDELSPVIEDYRQMGVFPPAIPSADDADLQTKLLNLAGRDA